MTVSSHGDARPLGHAGDQVVYRISLQEALTNAARHGTGTGTAAIELAFWDTALKLTITNGKWRTSSGVSFRGRAVVLARLASRPRSS